MTKKDVSADSLRILENTRVEIATARKNLQRLSEELAIAHETAMEIARNELCKALTHRLELAEQEASELAEMINANGKSS